MKNKLKILLLRFYSSVAYKMLIASYLIAVIGGLSISYWQSETAKKDLVANVEIQSQEKANTIDELTAQYQALQSEDQVAKNASLSAELSNIKSTYSDGSRLFEQRADLSSAGVKTGTVDKLLAKYLSLLSNEKWPEAKELGSEVQTEIDKLVVAQVPKVNVPTSTPSNTLPGSGYSRQTVTTSRGEFVVAMVVAPGARAVVETASESDCSNNCPTKSLAEHVASAGGFAGINGAYFCPPDYPRCQGKVNSFDTLAVNGRTKAVLNRANNVYSTVPLVTMYGQNLTFYDRTLDWGIDTGSNGAIANYPRLLRDGNVATTEDNGRGLRGFIGVKDGAIVIGQVYAASFGDEAEVLHTLGLQNALNLDGGGSSALWVDGGYKVGPGRSLPTAIVLVH